MELMFNELSVVPYSANKYDAIERMTLFAKTFKKSMDFGFKRIRSDVSVSEILLADDYTVHSWLIDSAVSPELKGFMFGSIITPFINEEDGQVEEAFIEAEYFYKRNEAEKVPCLGLAAAHLYELPTISLNTSAEWQRNLLPIIVEKDETSEDHQIHNVFDESCFGEEGIAAFVENLGEVELIETKLNPDEKDIHLADHHGKDELQALCNQLKYNQYVTAMRSTDWGGNTFIRKIHKNGVVEITLFKSQRKYALWVQTTGRNYRETEAIAHKLRERYS
ncbi:hypothetical protein [Peijinzhouia sedimentorum]